MAYDKEADPVSADMLVLQRARDRIAAGWCQDRLQYEGAVCIMGGINCANTGSHGYLEGPILPYIEKWASLLGFDGFEVIEWNNAPERTQAEVLDRFDTAIDRLARLARGVGG